MVQFTLIPEGLRNIYDSWSSVAKNFHEKTSKYENYFLGDVDDTDTPFDKNQLKRIRKTTGVESTINRIYSTTSQAIAILARKRQSNRMVAIDNKYKNHSITLDKIKQGIQIDSYSTVAEEESIKDMLISGMGFKNVRPPNDQFETIFPAVIEHIHSSEVVLDINCTDRTLRKMQGYFIDKEISLAQAQKLYQDKINQINQLQIAKKQREITWDVFTNVTAGKRNRRAVENLVYGKTLWVREFYDKIYSKCYLVKDSKIGLRKLFDENLLPVQKSLLNNTIRIDEDLYVRRTTLLGDYVIDVETMPITDWSLVAKFFEWGGKPYKSKGFVHFSIPMQQAYDSTLQLLLLNGYITTNSGWKAPRGAIKSSEKRQVEENLLDPTKMFLYDPVVIGDKVLIPEKDVPGQISNFYVEMLNMFPRGMYEVTGMDPILLGMSSETQVEAFSSLSKFENNAMQRIMLQYDHISVAQIQEGNVLIEFMTSELKPSMIPFLDTQGNINEVEFTTQSLMEAKLCRYKVYAIPYEAMPTQRIAVSTELLKIAQTTNDPSERKIFIHHALKLQDIREVDELLDEINEVQNLQSLAKQMEEQLKRMGEINKQSENRALRAEYNAKLYARLIKAIENIAKQENNEVLQAKIFQLQLELKETRKISNKSEKST